MESIRLRPSRTGWLTALMIACTLVTPFGLSGQRPEVRVVSDNAGAKLQVDGQDFMVLGMNWDYFPVGTTTTYNFWAQPDEFIRQALDNEMSLLRAMGVNAIRVYVGIPAKWVNYIYERYGIFSIVNHAVGRYGVTIDGVYYGSTDYSDPAARAQLTGEVVEMVEELKDSPGVLMWLLGNENNYGLVWSSAETESLPEGERDGARARYLYSLMGDVVEAVKQVDPSRPVSMANGDLQYLDIIAEEVQGLDVFGSNVYRGVSFGDLFARVDQAMGIPVMFTEFGADAFDAIRFREDQTTQARYLVAQWKEIYEQSHGKGLVGNSIGGLTFQWSDGWWKFGQEDRLDIQDINASWPNDAYPEDYREGENNMNEEWWGIMAKGPTDAFGFFDLYPRAAYYALQEAYTLDPYGPNTDLATIQEHFNRISPEGSAVTARADKAALSADNMGPFRLSEVRADLETFSTGAFNTSTPKDPQPGVQPRPSFQGFDHLQSFYLGASIDPQPNFTGEVSVNILGNVPNNPIDEIFYENRGRSVSVQGENGSIDLEDVERVKVYRAGFSWDERLFRLDGFYRTGHYHWAYEGDFFNMYREANYGENIDIYNGVAPSGFELEAKGALTGFKLAMGPELWWGANPALMAKYERTLAGVAATAVFQEDFQRANQLNSSFAVPLPENRRLSVHLQKAVGPWTVDLGGLWSGSKLVGRDFQIANEIDGGYEVLQDQVKDSDTWGGKAKLSLQSGRWNWYVQGAAMGLVASGGGADQAQTFTGWALKDTGSGNQWHVLSGLAVKMGSWEIAPNFLFQKPLVGPVPSDVPEPGRPRNVIDDPFAVRANREQTAGELLITWDPTPATWMYSWDSDIREDAPFAASLGFTYRHLPTTQDAAIGILPDGRTPFAFPGAAPAQDLWEVRTRLVSKASSTVGWVANLYGGTAQANGDDARLIERFGGDIRFLIRKYKIMTFAKFNDWGPYDYHRDFNYTFPVQLMLDLSRSFSLPNWFGEPQTQFGIRGAWRSLDQYSNRYCPARIPDASDPTGFEVCDPTALGDTGNEWEIRTYLQIGF